MDELKKWAASAGVSPDAQPEDLCKNPEVVKMVTADLNKIGKGTLGGNEALATVRTSKQDVAKSMHGKCTEPSKKM